MTFTSFPTRLSPVSRSTMESIFLTVLPHGGQGTARRNAWGAMAADAAQARRRREAEVAVDRAVARATARASHPASR